jgi:hypothetical protein
MSSASTGAVVSVVPAPHARTSRRPAPARRRAAPLRRHLHQLLRPGDRRRGARRSCGGGPAAALAGNGCCGRPQISKGLLDDARLLAKANAERLYDDAQAGRPLVFCEPSCLSAVREDAPALLRGEARRKAQVVAGASVLFEEYVAGVGTSLPLAAGPGRVLLHGHCHQRSMGLVAPPRRCSRAFPA